MSIIKIISQQIDPATRAYDLMENLDKKVDTFVGTVKAHPIESVAVAVGAPLVLWGGYEAMQTILAYANGVHIYANELRDLSTYIHNEMNLYGPVDHAGHLALLRSVKVSLNTINVPDGYVIYHSAVQTLHGCAQRMIESASAWEAPSIDTLNKIGPMPLPSGTHGIVQLTDQLEVTASIAASKIQPVSAALKTLGGGLLMYLGYKGMSQPDVSSH